MLSPLLGMAAINSILFGVHAEVLQRLQPEGGLPSIWKSFVAGGIGGLAQVWICCPMELIKLRMQAQKEPVPLLGGEPKSSGVRLYSDPLDCGRKLYAEGHRRGGVYGAVRSLNQGFVVLVYRDVPGYGCYFACYHYICSLLLRLRYDQTCSLDQLSTLESCMAGGAAGILSWVSTYPLDVVKSRMQVDGMYGNGHTYYKGVIHCFQQSYKEELRAMAVEYEQEPDHKPRPTKWRAMRVFVKGINSTVVRAFPVNCVIFGTYVIVLRCWRNVTDSLDD